MTSPDVHPSNDAPVFTWRLLLPQYWATWLGLIFILPLAYLPLMWQFAIGRWLGRQVYRLAAKRRRDTLVNLKLCYPHLDTQEHQQMAQAVFVNAGIGLFESMCAWLRPQLFERKVTISGMQHIVNAQQADKGILLLGAHYTLLDLGGYLSSIFFEAAILYRPQNNALLEWVIYRLRSHIYAQQIGYRQTRQILQTLKQGQILWYTPDQDFGLKNGVMAPFFGVPAATITIPRKLARLKNVETLAIHFYRQDDRRPHYHITITPPLADYPSQDEVADATKVNELLEGLINIAPTQYMWFHRRFKNQEKGINYYHRGNK